MQLIRTVEEANFVEAGRNEVFERDSLMVWTVDDAIR